MARVDIKKEIADYAIAHKELHYRLAYSYVRNADDALDIVQEAIYKAFSASNSLEEPRYIKTWFYRIVVNTSLDFLRKRKRLVIIDDELLTNLDVGKSDNYEDFDLKLAMENLPEPFKTIITLRYFEDLKIEEIAEVLEENTNTIKTRLYKGLKMLRINMDDNGVYKEAQYGG